MNISCPNTGQIDSILTCKLNFKTVTSSVSIVIDYDNGTEQSIVPSTTTPTTNIPVAYSLPGKYVISIRTPRNYTDWLTSHCDIDGN